MFLKSYATGRVAQRVGPVSLVMSTRFQAWLRRENDGLANVYVSVNAVRPGQLTRTRRAIRDIRHIFAEADHDGAQVVRTIDGRPDLPRPSYLLHSSPNRVHVFWRASGFAIGRAESLQKRLARELRTDSAATPVSQMTRLPGFLNHKYKPPHLVTVEYRCADRVYAPARFSGVRRDRGPEAARGERHARPSASWRGGTGGEVSGGAAAGDRGPAWGPAHVPRVLPSRARFCAVRRGSAQPAPPLEQALRATLVGAGTDRQAVEGSPLRSRADWRSVAGPPMKTVLRRNRFVDARAPYGRARYRRSPASTSTRANATDGVGPRPSSSPEDTHVRDHRSHGVLLHQSARAWRTRREACRPELIVATDTVPPSGPVWLQCAGAIRQRQRFSARTRFGFAASSRTAASRPHSEQSWHRQATGPSARRLVAEHLLRHRDRTDSVPSRRMTHGYGYCSE